MGNKLCIACRRYTSGCFFFFQAEDGIRDYKVTGVQTCALPILEVASTNPGQNGDGAQITLRVRAIVVGDKTYTVAADATPEATLVTGKVENVEDRKSVV